MALHQHTGTQRRRHPPARAHGHFVEPLLERKASGPSHHAVPALQNIRHGGLSALGITQDEECEKGQVAAPALRYLSKQRKAKCRSANAAAFRACERWSPCGYVTCPMARQGARTNSTRSHLPHTGGRVQAPALGECEPATAPAPRPSRVGRRSRSRRTMRPCPIHYRDPRTPSHRYT